MLPWWRRWGRRSDIDRSNEPYGFRGFLDGRGCGRVGPSIARAVHSPGRWDNGRGAERLCKEVLRGLLPKSLQQTLHDRMLFRSELVGVFLAQSTHDGDRGQLRLRSEPILDRCDVRVELGRHANPRFITS